jgi:hypothetical protein
MPKIDSLYQLIKKKSIEYGRPLKVISDWDEVIQPVNPVIWYQLSKQNGWYEGELSEFKEWFEWFWKNSTMQFSDRGGESTKTGFSFNKHVEEIIKDPQKFQQLIFKPFLKILNKPDYYKNAPLLSSAKDLLQALDDGYIERLNFISTTRGEDNRKATIMATVFAYFQNKADVKLYPQGNFKDTGKKRCDIIKERWPDFDVFVDDNPQILTETYAVFGSKRIYASPKYQYLLSDWKDLINKDNVYLFPTYVTNLERTAPYVPKSLNSKDKTNKDLYTLIKEQYRKKGRPLRLVCDWDECIQPVSPLMWYRVVKENGLEEKENPLEPFEEYFKRYWREARIEYKQNIPYTRDTKIKAIEEIRKRTDSSVNYDFDYLDFDPDKYDNEFNRKVRKPQYKVLNDPNYYENAPFLSFARDLLKALDEGLIERLAFITTTRGVDHRKQRVFNRVFKDRSKATEITLFPQGHYRNTGERRVDIIKKKWPNFDVFIDDSVGCIRDALKEFPDRTLVAPNYPIIDYPKAENVNLIDNFPVDLKYEKQIKEIPVSKESIWKQPTTYLLMSAGAGIVLLFLGIYWLLKHRKRERERERERERNPAPLSNKEENNE